MAAWVKSGRRYIQHILVDISEVKCFHPWHQRAQTCRCRADIRCIVYEECARIRRRNDCRHDIIYAHNNKIVLLLMFFTHFNAFNSSSFREARQCSKSMVEVVAKALKLVLLYYSIPSSSSFYLSSFRPFPRQYISCRTNIISEWWPLSGLCFCRRCKMTIACRNENESATIAAASLCSVCVSESTRVRTPMEILSVEQMQAAVSANGIKFNNFEP